MGDDAAHIGDKNGFAVVNALGKGNCIGVHQPLRFKADIAFFQQWAAQPVAVIRIGCLRASHTDVRVENVLKPALRLMVLTRLSQPMGNQKRQVEKQLPVERAVGAVEIDGRRCRRYTRWLRL
ncbi:hypothetical protein D3C86_1411420 [compost metagenome]